MDPPGAHGAEWGRGLRREDCGQVGPCRFWLDSPGGPTGQGALLVVTMACYGGPPPALDRVGPLRVYVRGVDGVRGAGSAGARFGRRDSGVRAATTTCTLRAPPARSAADAADTVAPLVTTSSTSRTRRGTPGPAANAGPRRRSARVRPVWDPGPGLRPRTPRHGLPRRRATARARSSAWSKPRRRRRTAAVGAQVTTSISVASTRAAIAAARKGSEARALRYFMRATSSRPTPS